MSGLLEQSKLAVKEKHFGQFIVFTNIEEDPTKIATLQLLFSEDNNKQKTEDGKIALEINLRELLDVFTNITQEELNQYSDEELKELVNKDFNLQNVMLEIRDIISRHFLNTYRELNHTLDMVELEMQKSESEIKMEEFKSKVKKQLNIDDETFEGLISGNIEIQKLIQEEAKKKVVKKPQDHKPKAKRKRRTKAEIEADKLAKASEVNG